MTQEDVEYMLAKEVFEKFADIEAGKTASRIALATLHILYNDFGFTPNMLEYFMKRMSLMGGVFHEDDGKKEKEVITLLYKNVEKSTDRKFMLKYFGPVAEVRKYFDGDVKK